MPSIHLAPLGEPLIARLAEAIARAKRDRPLGRVTVVTPSFYSSFFLRRALAPRGLFNVEFVRVEDLAEQLAGTSLTTTPISRLHAAELVFATVAAGEAGGFDAIRDHPALHRALHRTFADLQTIDARAIEAIERLGGRYRDLIALWRAYQARSLGYHDRFDVALAARRSVKSQGWHWERLGNLVLLLVEPPPPQYRPLVEALARVAGAAVVAGVTGEAPVDAAVADVAGHSLDPGPDPSLPNVLKLVSAADRAAEARWIVGNIARLAARPPTRLGRVAVLYADESQGRRIEEALSEAGIPISGPDRTAAAAWPEGRFVSLLLRALGQNLARDKVAAWLTSSPVRLPGTLTAVPGARWDRVSRAAGITGGAALWQERLEAYSRRRRRQAELAEDADGATAMRLRGFLAEAAEAERLAAFMAGLASHWPPPQHGSWTGHAAWLESLIVRYMAEPQDDAALGRRNSIGELLRRIAELDVLQARPPSFERFTAVLLSELARPASNVRALGRGVFVAPVRDAAGCHFDVVHITGMAEGAFPHPDSPDPLLPDDVRNDVRRAAGPSGSLLSTRAERSVEARRRFLLALASAPEVYLSWPRWKPGAAREAGPARWFLEAAKSVSGDERLQAGDLIGRAPQAWLALADASPADPSDAGDPGDLHAYDLKSAAAWTRAGRAAQQHYLAAETGGAVGPALRLERARSSGDWTIFDGDLTSRELPEVATLLRPAGATALEQWATCPFRYFLGYVLQLPETDRPEEVFEVSPLERGRLVHRILEEFVSSRATDRDRLPQDDEERRLVRIAHQVLSKFGESSPVGHPALWAIETERIVRGLRAWRRREAGVAAVGEPGLTRTEVRFGVNAGEERAVALALPGGESAVLRGAIDRVDISADGRRAAIYDYKTGRPDTFAARADDPLNRGRSLQLAVYAAAVESAFPELVSISAQYWFVFEPGSKELLPPKWDETAAKTALADALGTIIPGIKSGVFPAVPGEPDARPGRPESSKNCVNCAFDRLCPAGREWMWRRKSADARVGHFAALAREQDPAP